MFQSRLTSVLGMLVLIAMPLLLNCDGSEDPDINEGLFGFSGTLSFNHINGIMTYFNDINMSSSMVNSRLSSPPANLSDINSINVSYDGRILVPEKNSVSILSLDGKKDLLFQEKTGIIRSPKLSPNNDLVLYLHEDDAGIRSVVLREPKVGGREVKRYVESIGGKFANWNWTAKQFLVLAVGDFDSRRTYISNTPVDPMSVPDIGAMRMITGGGTISPDATRIIYLAASHLWQKKIDGSDSPVQLTESPGFEYDAIYSPSGKSVAFLSTPTMASDGIKFSSIYAISLSAMIPVHVDVAQKYYKGIVWSGYTSLLQWR